MLPLVAVFAGVAIAATAASWLLDSLTEEERERQDQLNSELSELKNKFDLKINVHNQNMYEIARENYEKIKEKFLKEVEFYKNEKKDIKNDLEKLTKAISDGLSNEAISPYQKQSLLDNRNKVEDAKNRLDAYWKYLDWFENELNDLAKYKKYNEIFDLDMPQALLPEDYIYLGKLAYITKEEISIKNDTKSGWNRYDQKLQLDDYHNKNELTVYESNMPELIILVIKNKNNKFFTGSAIKGELYQYILDNMSFEVKPKFNEKQNQEKLILLYKDVDLNIKRPDKLYPLKKYKERDSFEVKIQEYDLLLRNIFVTEKYTDRTQEISSISIPIVFEISEGLPISIIEQLDMSLQRHSFQALRLEGTQLQLKVDNYMLSLTINQNENLLNLLDISLIDINKTASNSFVIPYEIVLIEKNIYDQTYKGLSLNRDHTFNDFSVFIKEQFNYITYSSKNINNDFDFFKKWQRIIDYQIEENFFDKLIIPYTEYEIDGNAIVFYVQNLNTYSNKFKDKKPWDITIELDDINIGFLDDYSIEENILKSKIDFIKDLGGIQKSSQLSVKIKNYQSVLQKQKKALKDFSFSKIVNHDLKQMLVSPNLITYKQITNNFKLNFKNNNLTVNQKDTIRKAFNEKNIFLIQGPPGTGKTTIIKEMIYQTIKQDRCSKILIVSQQNVAVDNVLDGIDRENREWFEKDGHTIVRIAPNENKIQYENIKEFTVENWFEHYKGIVKSNFIKLEQNKNHDLGFFNNFNFSSEFKDKKELNKKLYNFANEWMGLIYKSDFRDMDNEIKELLISKHQIIGATCVGLANKSLGLDLIEFDIAIIDEAGRATAPELLIPLLRAKKVILIGDHNQLPPTIDRKLLKKLEKDDEDDLNLEDLEILKKSFFEELFEKVTDSNKAMLNEQFRMPENIGNLISTLFYENKLTNGQAKDINNFLDPDNIIRWVDVSGKHEFDGTSSYNLKEVDSIVNLLQKISLYLEKKKVCKSIGIITPYSAQKRKIRNKIKTLNLLNISNLKIDTVDSFQGEEADIIIYSTVKTYGNISFLIDKKRLNVAISRTKENLIFIGKKSFFSNAKVKNNETNLFKQIITYIQNT
ncbi:AAA family ATPase [bacterium]|jgi:superfamily I DNA and/or RNA helicase|nr:AAA family ATPase [bacterium]